MEQNIGAFRNIAQRIWRHESMEAYITVLHELTFIRFRSPSVDIQPQLRSNNRKCIGRLEQGSYPSNAEIPKIRDHQRRV